MKTIRIQNIAACATRQDILNFFDGLDPIEETLTLATFGITAKKVATLAFPTEQLAKTAARRNLTKLVPEADKQKATVVTIDGRFLGATPLTNGSENVSKAIDIFLIHSPGWHGLEAWSHRHADGTETNWPRDLLPVDFPHARIILVGLKGVPFKKKRALWLQDSMEEVTAAITDPRLGSKARPAVYIAHSFSGVYLQAALISTMPELARVQDWAIGTVFFATPNPGTKESTKSTSSTPENKDAPKTLAKKIQSSAILQLVCREFIQRVNERNYHVVSIIEGANTIGPGGPIKFTDRDTSVLNLDPGHETVLPSDRNLEEMCRYESRDSLRYAQLVRSLKTIEQKAPARIMGTWGIIRKWILSQSPRSGVELSCWEEPFDDYDSFSASVGLIVEEGVQFIVKSPATYLVFKGDPATGIDAYSRRVAMSMLRNTEGAVYLHAAHSSTTVADFWKAILGQISSWNNQWIRNHVTDLYYKHLAGQCGLGPQSTLFPIGLMAGGGYLKYILLEGLDLNPNKEVIMGDLKLLVRNSGGKLKVIFSVCDDSGLRLEEANTERFSLLTEDICQAHFQRYASQLLDKLHEGKNHDWRFGSFSYSQVSPKDFKDISELYNHIFTTLLIRWRTAEDPELIEKVRKVLMLVIFSYRPLHIEELLGAMDPEKRETTKGKLEVELSEFRIFVEENLGPFLEFDTQGPGMVTLENHQFRVFLLASKDIRSWLLDSKNVPDDPEAFEQRCHVEVLMMCLSTIRHLEYRWHLQRNQPGWIVPLYGHVRGMAPPTCGFYTYATEYWLEHLKKSRVVVAKTAEPPIGFLLARIANIRFNEAAKALATTASSMASNHASRKHKQAFSHLGIHALNDDHGRQYCKLVREQLKFLGMIKKTNATFQTEIFLRRLWHFNDDQMPDTYTFDLDSIQMEDEPLSEIIIKYFNYGVAFIRRRFNSEDGHGLTYAEMLGELPSHPPNRSSMWKAMDNLKRNTVKSAHYHHIGDLERRIEFLKVADSLRNITILLQTTGFSTAIPQYSDYKGYPLIDILSEASQILNVLASFDLPTKIEDFDFSVGLDTQYLTLFKNETTPQIYRTTASLFSPNTPKSGRRQIQLANADRILMSSINKISFEDQFRTMCTLTFVLHLFSWPAMKYNGLVCYPLLLITLGCLMRYTDLFASQWRLAKIYAAFFTMRIFPPINGSSTQDVPVLSNWEAPQPVNFCKGLFTLCLYRLASYLLLGVEPFPAIFLKALVNVTLWSTIGFGNAILEPFFAFIAMFLDADRRSPAMAKWKRNLLSIWIPIDVFRFALDLIPSMLGNAQKEFLASHVPQTVLGFFLAPPPESFTYHLFLSLFTPLALYAVILPYFGRLEFNVLRTCIFSINTVMIVIRVINLSVDWLVETEFIGFIWLWFTLYSVWRLYDWVRKIVLQEEEWEYWYTQARLDADLWVVLRDVD